MATIRDRDGDVWRIRIRILPPLPQMVTFRRRSRAIGSLPPAEGVGDAYYRLVMRGQIFLWLIMLWPLVLAGQLLANAITATASLFRRVGGREDWVVQASRSGHERARTLHWGTATFAGARRAARRIAQALAAGKGLYEIPDARLLDAPLFERDRRD